jgi:hypothetical protein
MKDTKILPPIVVIYNWLLCIGTAGAARLIRARVGKAELIRY